MSNFTDRMATAGVERSVADGWEKGLQDALLRARNRKDRAQADIDAGQRAKQAAQADIDRLKAMLGVA
jgi:hypothetical protein